MTDGMTITADRSVDPWRVLGAEIGEGMRAILREPTAWFFSVVMPVGFYALFASLYGAGGGTGGLPPYAVTSLATFGAFGVLSVMLLTPGVKVADDRTRGWLRVKKVSAASPLSALVARVIAALPYALGVILAMSAVSLAIAGPVIGLGAWLALMGALLLGALPFALIGLAVGFVASSNATVAILNAVLIPMSVASGLWLPLQILPEFVQTIAQFLPTYHLGQLALAQLTGAPAWDHLLALLLTTAVGAVLAGFAYRNLRV